MSTNFFSSLSGNFDYMSSMSGLLGDYASIKNGSYGSLMKSYVKKVGNQAALNAYRETGSTTTGYETDATTSTNKTSSSSKTSFLDSHLSSIGKSSSSSESTKKTDTTASATATTTADAYAKYKSSWLDDQLKQYDKDATKTTAADTSVAYDTTI